MVLWNCIRKGFSKSHSCKSSNDNCAGLIKIISKRLDDGDDDDDDANNQRLVSKSYGGWVQALAAACLDVFVWWQLDF